MKSVIVMLRTGTRVVLKAKYWTMGTSGVSLIDGADEHVAMFPVEAVAGLWWADCQEQIKTSLGDESKK